MPLDVRPIAAVDGSIDSAIEEARLRPDLYERLSLIRVDVPALRRERIEVHHAGRACAFASQVNERRTAFISHEHHRACWRRDLACADVLNALRIEKSKLSVEIGRAHV